MILAEGLALRPSDIPDTRFYVTNVDVYSMPRRGLTGTGQRLSTEENLFTAAIVAILEAIKTWPPLSVVAGNSIELYEVVARNDTGTGGYIKLSLMTDGTPVKVVEFTPEVGERLELTRAMRLPFDLPPGVGVAVAPPPPPPPVFTPPPPQRFFPAPVEPPIRTQIVTPADIVRIEESRLRAGFMPIPQPTQAGLIPGVSNTTLLLGGVIVVGGLVWLMTRK